MGGASRSAQRGADARGALPAKAAAPRLANVVPRARVFRILDQALSRGAAWVVGPAGAGKTTAVASHLAARRRPAVWYDVDANDTDVANVFLYLAKGVGAATRSRARTRLPVFQVAHLGSLRAFARKFFEALFAALPPRAALVLDNCHTATDHPLWTEILDEAVQAVPANRGLVLASRAEPPAGLSRQVVNDRLARVTGEELRFSSGEAAALARSRVPARLRKRKEALASLCALADGWAAGLVLVLDRAARGETDPQLARRDGRLFEYFGAEILSQLPPETQQVLLATALLPCMTERMAAAVSGSDGAGALLADLHRRGLLIERLPTAEVTYRYHPLLRAFLLDRADQSAAMLARAAAACAEGGFLDEAVDLHERVGAEGEIATLVLTHAQRLVAEGRYQTLGAWLEKLSEAALASQPWLRFWKASASVAHAPATSRAAFEQAFAGFQAAGDAAGMYLSIAGATQVIFVESEDFNRLAPWFRRFSALRAAGPRAPSDDIEAMALTGLLTGGCYWRPSHPELGPWVERARELAPGDVGVRLRLGAALVLYRAIVGPYDLGEDLLAGMRQEISRADPVTRATILSAEFLDAYRGTWRALLGASERILALARETGLRAFEPSYLAGAALSWAQGGDPGMAEDLLRRAATEAGGPRHLVLAGALELARGMVAVSARRFDEAVRQLDMGVVRAERTACGFAAILMRLLRCVALNALDRHDEAAREAAAMVGDVPPTGGEAVGMALLAAESDLRKGDAEAARACSRALEEARTWGIGATFYLRGLPLVVAQGLVDPRHGKWLAEYIAAHRIEPAPEHLDLPAWPFAARVQTLGGFVVKGPAGGKRSRKPQKAPLRLLKGLVATGGASLPVGAACDELWPDEAHATARRKLDVTVHRLRKLLGDDIVRLADGALVIDRTRCFIDAWAFESLATRAERRLRGAAGEALSGKARDLFEEARRLYRGTLLPGDDDLPSVVSYRERLRRRFVHLVLAFGAALEASRLTDAVVLYEQAVEVDELAEPLSQGLMRGYLALGRAADAANEYHRCGQALKAALGALPSEETRALYQQSQATVKGGVRATAR
jgi:DNA-binding SARP family transcriptional activator